MRNVRIFVVALAAILSLSAMVACGGNGETTTAGTTAAKTTASAAKTTAKPPKKTEAPSKTTQAPTAPETPEVPAETPATGDAVNEMLAGTKIEVAADSVKATGATFWNDGAAANLFDGDAGEVGTEGSGTKLGGGDITESVVVTWSTAEATTVKSYVLYTGGDSAKWTGRTPTAWTLSGSTDGENWTVIDDVKNSGMEDANATPYGYTVDTPAAYTQYKLEITDTTGDGKVVQINELVLLA